MASTAVSIEADRIYTRALKALADKEGRTVGVMVKSAVDVMFGDQLKPYIDFFVAQDGDKSVQMEAKAHEATNAA